MIRKLGNGQYRLYSRKIDSRTGKRRNLGTFSSLAKAQQHERADEHAALELALRVVGREAVGVVDELPETGLRDAPQGFLDRRLGPAAAARVIEPAAEDPTKAWRHATAHRLAHLLGEHTPGL